MDLFRRFMRGSLAGWRRTSGKAGTRGAASDRKRVHRAVRQRLKRETREEDV